MPAPPPALAMQHVVAAVANQVEAALDRELNQIEAETEADPELVALRQRRLAEWKQSAAERAKWHALGHGKLNEFDDEEALLEACRSSARVVGVFWRLQAVAETRPFQDALAAALRSLAEQHLETRFWCAEATRFPSLCEQLGVSILPSIVLIQNQQRIRVIPGLDWWLVSSRDGPRFSSERFVRTLRRHRLIDCGSVTGSDRRDESSDSE
ncbi:hypothetical protein CCYA_CCYA19G4700 [Cyanidiococcus yangmingshanensis]|nr:hypothetical protein CCYA_CCYA19G4664 [Cyanidiococcus yangmingshanensis]KAK4533818.1 hypothetical protein CCYA_CCYA19G4700 [Cyanidiococcus yangmingshanensis]